MAYEITFRRDRVTLNAAMRKTELWPEMDKLVESMHSQTQGMSQGRFSTSTLLSPAIRYVTDTDIVMEKPPCRMTIDITPALKSQAERVKTLRFTLNIPWVVYLIYVDLVSDTISSIKVFFRQGPLGSLNDRVSIAPLPNLYSDASLCLPDNIKKYLPTHDGPMSLSTLSQAAYNFTWGSGFNADLVKSLTDINYNSMMDVQPHHRKNMLEMVKGIEINLSGWYVSKEEFYNILTMFCAWEEKSMSEILDIDWTNWMSTWGLRTLFQPARSSSAKSFVRALWTTAATTPTMK